MLCANVATGETGDVGQVELVEEAEAEERDIVEVETHGGESAVRETGGCFDGEELERVLWTEEKEMSEPRGEADGEGISPADVGRRVAGSGKGEG